MPLLAMARQASGKKAASSTPKTPASSSRAKPTSVLSPATTPSVKRQPLAELSTNSVKRRKPSPVTPSSSLAQPLPVALEEDDTDYDPEEDLEYVFDGTGDANEETEDGSDEAEGGPAPAKKDSKTEMIRKKFFPHLRRLDAITKRSIDLHPYKVSSFKVIDVGRTAKSLPHDDTDWEAYQQAATAKIRHVLTEYQRRAREGRLGAIMSGGAASYAKYMDIEDEIDEIHLAMNRNTLATLGRPDLELRHIINDMAPMTDRDLEKWLVYVGFIVDQHGNVWAYVGSSVALDGSTARLIACYEKALQYAKKGLMLSSLSTPGLARHAVMLDAKSVHLRCLCSFYKPKISDSDDLKKEISRQVKFYEGIFTDVLQTMDKVDRVIELPDRTISQLDMAELSTSMALPGQTSFYKGLNLCHPMSQGFASQSHVEALNLAAERQKNVCPLDGHDLRIPYQRGSLTYRLASNPLKGVVDWAPEEVICTRCYYWVYKPAAMARVVAECNSWEECLKLRQDPSRSARQWDLRKAMPKTPDGHICWLDGSDMTTNAVSDGRQNRSVATNILAKKVSWCGI